MLLIIIKLFLLLIFILFIAYFAGAETALLSVSSGSLAKIKNKSPSNYKYIESWEQKPANILTGIVLGSNLASIAAGIISTSLAIDLGTSGRVLLKWMIIPGITLVILVFGEILPKVYSRYNAEKVSILLIGLLKRFNLIINPASQFFIGLSEKALKLMKVELTTETPFLNSKELRTLLFAYSRELEGENAISSTGSRMLANILTLVDQKVEQIMIPKNQIFAIDSGRSFDDIVNDVLVSKYSRVPVYSRSKDNILGIIYTKDLIMMKQNKELFMLEDLIRPAYFVFENISLNSLLREFRKNHYHMAVVVDEYGATSGLVTIEDIVEEIVGEIYDEYDVKEKKIVRLPDNSWVLPGEETIRNINEELGINLYYQDVVTINGLIITRLGHIPVNGETFEIDSIKIEILEADEKKIKKVKIVRK